MKQLAATLLLGALAALTGCAQTPTTSDEAAKLGTEPLRPLSQCIDVEKVGEWYVVEPDTVILRTGPKYFRIDMQQTCPGLGLGGGLSFRINPANAMYRRLCGDTLDAIYARGIPCPIEKVTPISEQRFRELEDLPQQEQADS